jgi:hypothetical protein
MKPLTIKRLYHYLFFVLLLCTGSSYADDFSQAIAKIDSIKPNIVYSSFCKSMPGGEDKIACQIKSIPTIALLVCKASTYGNKTCKDIISEEIENLAAVKKSGLKTVDFKTNIIEPLKCANEKSNECAGYLARWVSNAQFTNIDDSIEAGQISELATEIRSYTATERNLATTRSDIKKIAQFMAPESGKYSRICDLQGFYLHGGGFLINDVPTLEIKQSTKPDCWAEMPSYNNALKGINDLVDGLK